jgi:hypothetical protein
VKVGTTWYGPVPIDFVILPNTNRYHSAWLDGIITGPVFGCLPVRFTYSTNFSSPPFINSTVCPCR